MKSRRFAACASGEQHQLVGGEAVQVRRAPAPQRPPRGRGTRPRSHRACAARADRGWPVPLVEPAMIPIFLPAMSSNRKIPMPDLTRTPVLSANTRLEKSTIFMRDSETVVDPHSMSAEPSTIASNRVRVSTGTHLIASAGRRARVRATWRCARTARSCSRPAGPARRGTRTAANPSGTRSAASRSRERSSAGRRWTARRRGFQQGRRSNSATIAHRMTASPWIGRHVPAAGVVGAENQRGVASDRWRTPSRRHCTALGTWLDQTGLRGRPHVWDRVIRELSGLVR